MGTRERSRQGAIVVIWTGSFPPVLTRDAILSSTKACSELRPSLGKPDNSVTVGFDMLLALRPPPKLGC